MTELYNNLELVENLHLKAKNILNKVWLTVNNIFINVTIKEVYLLSSYSCVSFQDNVKP